MIDEKKLIEALRASQNTGRESFHVDLIVEAIEEQPRVDEWILCDDQLPYANKDVLITFREYIGYSGKYVYGVCKAVYIPQHFIKSEDLWSQNDCYELEVYDEDEDCFYVKEGWYEIVENWYDYTHVYINKKVIAWTPLPEPCME